MQYASGSKRAEWILHVITEDSELTFPNTAIRVRSIYGNFIRYLKNNKIRDQLWAPAADEVDVNWMDGVFKIRRGADPDSEQVVF